MTTSLSPTTTQRARFRRSFDACYLQHRNDVFRQCLRYASGRRAWAEDATHDVFMQLLKHLPTLEAHDDLGGWLYRVAANLCISRLRKEQAAWRTLWRSAEPEYVMADAASDLVEQQTRAEIVQAIAALPARLRIVLMMKVLEGKSQREIADALEMSEGYVSKLVTRAWTRLAAAGVITEVPHG